MIEDDVAGVMRFYPMIYFACHTRHVEDKKTGVKLTAHQANILDHLDVEQPISLYDLAMHMGVTPSTMSITVDRIVKLGYVKKEKDKVDARKARLTLTGEGEKMKQSKSVIDPERIEAVLNRLTSTERKLALDGLALLAAAAEAQMKNNSLGKSWNNRNLKST